MNKKIKIYSIFNKQEELFLRKPVSPVISVSPEIKSLVLRMKDIMKNSDGVGLAANQIGESVRLFVAEYENKFYAIINPEIFKTSKSKKLMEEGCLSVPGIFGVVRRFQEVEIKGLNQDGKKIKLKAKGQLACVFQHEIDHLNGILFVDRAEKIARIDDDEK